MSKREKERESECEQHSGVKYIISTKLIKKTPFCTEFYFYLSSYNNAKVNVVVPLKIIINFTLLPTIATPRTIFYFFNYLQILLK